MALEGFDNNKFTKKPAKLSNYGAQATMLPHGTDK